MEMLRELGAGEIMKFLFSLSFLVIKMRTRKQKALALGMHILTIQQHL